MHLTLKEQQEAKKWGVVMVVDFINPHGVPFRKHFTTQKEADHFMDNAEVVGTTVKEIHLIKE